MNVRTAVLALLALAAGCKPSLLPGTDVPESRDTRAVYDVMQAYRAALEKRDPKAVLALVAPTYFDTAGTPEPGDDLDRAGLEASLEKDLPRTEGQRVELTIRKIEVNGDDAVVEIFYDSFYRVKAGTALVPRRDSDLERVRLKRIEGAWKFMSGL
ncbi:MAG TPA: DUF4440 domain-containing protein [Anaeromyxobacter sp.]